MKFKKHELTKGWLKGGERNRTARKAESCWAVYQQRGGTYWNFKSVNLIDGKWEARTEREKGADSGKGLWLRMGRVV